MTADEARQLTNERKGESLSLRVLRTEVYPTIQRLADVGKDSTVINTNPSLGNGIWGVMQVQAERPHMVAHLRAEGYQVNTDTPHTLRISW